MSAAPTPPEQEQTPEAPPARKRLFVRRLRARLGRIKRPRFGLRRLAKKKINEQLKGEPLTFGRGVEEFFNLIGFSAVVEAWKHPTKRTRKVLSSVFNKAADMAAGSAVNKSIRLIAITMLTGFMGGSVLLTMGLTALAAGAGSALYTYHRNYLKERFGKSEELRKTAKYFCRARLKQAGFAFLGSAVGGAFGAWLGKTEFVQSIIKSIKHAAHMVFESLHSGVNTGIDAVQNIATSAPQAPAIMPHAGRLTHAFDAARLPAPAFAPVTAALPAPVPARGFR